MVQVSYWETLFYQKFKEELEIKRLELLEGLGRGCDYEEYLRQVGQLNGLKIAEQLATEIAEKVRSS